MKRVPMALVVLMMSTAIAVGQPSTLPAPLRMTDYREASEPDDWMSRTTNPGAAIPMPVQGASVAVNPPNFVWPWPDGAGRDLSFEIELRYPNNQKMTTRTSDAWISFWPEALYPSDIPYAWRVRAWRGEALVADWSAWRQFFVQTDAIATTPIDIDRLYRQAATRTRPKTMASGPALTALRRQYLGDAAPFRAEWAVFLRQLDADLTRYPPVVDPAGGGSGGRVGPYINRDVRQEVRLARDSAFAWTISGEARYLAEARRRTLNLADWQIANRLPCDWNTGIYCLSVNTQLTLNYDWLYHELSSSERSRIKQGIVARLSKVGGMRFFTESLYRSPLDSWGASFQVYLTMISAIMAGEGEPFDSLFKENIPLFLNRPNLWGSEDGGFGNGMGYAANSFSENLIGPYAIGRATGIDILRLPYVRHHPYFWLYFQPPVAEKFVYSVDFHSPGFFGDDAEEPIISAYLRTGMDGVLSQGNRDPAIAWYAEALRQGTPRRVYDFWMLDPVQTRPIAREPLDLPTSALFPTLGWVAMHSSLTDLNRTSVYFRSSRYGSVSHNHADQNSVVLHVGGVPLLIDSGYYDGYETNHNRQWNQQTKAHNAITFDGGQGQPIRSRASTGRIESYRFDKKLGVTRVTGNATRAYGGALSEARRTVIFMKPDTVIVYDRLASKTGRQWEWNLHSANPIEVLSNSEVKVQNQGKTACLALYASSPVAFDQTSDFGPNNADAPKGDYKRQFHGRFSTVDRSNRAGFLAVVRVGCGGGVAVAKEADLWRISNGTASVTIREAGDILSP